MELCGFLTSTSQEGPEAPGTGIAQGTAELRRRAGISQCFLKERFRGLSVMLKHGVQEHHSGSSECIETLRRPYSKEICSAQLSLTFLKIIWPWNPSHFLTNILIFASYLVPNYVPSTIVTIQGELFLGFMKLRYLILIFKGRYLRQSVHWVFI